MGVAWSNEESRRVLRVFPSCIHSGSVQVQRTHSNLFRLLAPGQTDRQVVAGQRNLNLRSDLRLVTARTHKFPRKYTQAPQIEKSNILRQTVHVLYSSG